MFLTKNVSALHSFYVIILVSLQRVLFYPTYKENKKVNT